MLLNAEEYNIHSEIMVKNIIQDETVHILESRGGYADYAHAYAILKEEIEEVEDELSSLNDSLNQYWKLIRDNAPDEALMERLQVITHIAINTIHEAKQVGAVAQKAIMQLSKEKAHTTVQSMYEPLKKVIQGDYITEGVAYDK